MRRPLKHRKKLRLSLFVFFVTALVVVGLVIYLKLASASFLGNGGNIAWGDTSTGRIRVGHYNFGSPGTFSGSFRPGTAPSASAIQFAVTKASPTRNEKLVGYQLNNGRLYVAKCTGSCAASGDLTANSWSWSPPTIVGTNTVTRAFDIAYEQKSGRAMVVYAGNTTGKLYYCIFDGTNWGPESDCAPTNGVNDITLSDGTTTLTGTPEWVRLVARGEQFTDGRTNDILMAVQDTNKNIMTIRWDGSSWVSADSQVLTTTGGGSVVTSQQAGGVHTPAFDIGWESVSGTEMAVYANGTALNYRTSTGSGFGSATTIQTLASAAQWIRVASDPQSNRMSMIVAFGSTTLASNATAHPYIWKGDGTTATWPTTLTTLTMIQDAGQNVSTAWEKAHSGTSKVFFSSSASANGTRLDTANWTDNGGAGTFSGWTAQSATGANDNIVSNELTPSPNSDIMNLMQADRDGRLRAWTYSGSAWGALISTNLTTSLINETTTKANNQTYIQKAYQYAYTPYAAWSLNWQVFDDEGATGNPGVSLAPEGVTPQVTPNNIVRLRMNYDERGGNGEGDTRKKLQYSSGAGCPDSSSCVWHDVAVNGATTDAWRYSTAGGVADNATVAGTLLDGSDTNGYEVTNGTGTVSGDQQGGGTTQEYDYTIQNYSATVGTTYYFRGYDYGPSVSGGGMTNMNAILREQIFDIYGTEATNCTTNAVASTCTYPSIQSFTSAPQAPIIYDPANGETSSISPLINLRTSDQQADYVQYVIEWCPTNSWPCASGGGSFDQTSSQTNWIQQNADGGLAYATSGTTEAGSAMGQYQVSPGVLQPNTTYYLRAKAIDPGGSATFSSYSSTYNFTTSVTDVRIQGGTTIKGGTIIQ